MSFLKTLQLMDLLTMQPLIRCVFEVVNLYSYFICSGFWCQRTTGQDSRSKEYIYWYTILDGPWSYSLWWESRCHLWLQGMANVLLQFLKYNYGQNLSLFCFWGVSTPLSFYCRLSACWGNSPYLFVLWLLSKVKLEDYSKFWVDTRTVIFWLGHWFWWQPMIPLLRRDLPSLSVLAMGLEMKGNLPNGTRGQIKNWQADRN